MLGSEGLESDRELYACGTVYVGKYVVLQLDHVALLLCNQ